MVARLVAVCAVVVAMTLAAGCTCVVPNPALCHGPEDCPGAYCDPVLMVCIDVDAPDSRADYIAFVSHRDGNDEIYRMLSDGSEQVNLTSDPGSDTEPLWDPAGERIAFLSDRDGLVQLFVMDLEGGNVVRISGGEASGAAWSPDGQVLAFTSNRTGVGEIFRVNVDGSMLTQLTTTGGVNVDWSPNDRLLFVESGVLSVMQADGSGQVPIVTSVPLPRGPRWKPDGTRIAFDLRFGQQVYVVDPDGSNLTNITNPPGFDQVFPRWSPTRNEVVVRDMVVPGGDVWILDASGSATRNVSMDGGSEPAWTPDGDGVVFTTSGQGGNADIYVVSRDGGVPTNLTNSPADDRNAHPRPRP